MNSLSPATQSDILGILQREQDRAVALLASSPLLASLFVSYANQAAALESVSATSPTESDEWKALENTISTLQEEVDKLKPENVKMAEKLEAGTASLEAFRSQVASLKEVNATHEREIHSLRAELIESKDGYDRLLEDSSAERDSLLKIVSDLGTQRADLRETVVEQQLKIAKLERQVEREEKEKAKQEAKHGPHQETGMGREERGQKSSAPTIPSTSGPTVEKDDPSRKPSTLPPKEQQKERGGGRSVGPTEKNSGACALPPIDTLSVPVDLPGGGEPASFTKKAPSDSAGKVEPRVPKENEDIHTPCGSSVVSSPVMPSKVAVCSQNECFNDAEKLYSPRSPRPTVVQPPVPEAPTTPKHWPAPPSARSPAPSKDEPEKPLSLWDRKKCKTTPAPGVSSSREPTSFPGAWGDFAGGTEKMAKPTLTESGAFLPNEARDQKRENQRENLDEWFLESSQRPRNESVQSQMTAKPASRPVSTSKPSGRGSWEEPIKSVKDNQDGPPSPEPVAPKLKGDPSGPAWNQPSRKNQPAAFSSPEKLARDNAWGYDWGDVGNVSTSKKHRVPSGTPVNARSKVLPENFQTNHPEDSSNIGPENIPESAVDIKNVPAPGRSHNPTMDEEEAEEIKMRSRKPKDSKRR